VWEEINKSVDEAAEEVTEDEKVKVNLVTIYSFSTYSQFSKIGMDFVEEFECWNSTSIGVMLLIPLDINRHFWFSASKILTRL